MDYVIGIDVGVNFSAGPEAKRLYSAMSAMVGSYVVKEDGTMSRCPEKPDIKGLIHVDIDTLDDISDFIAAIDDGVWDGASTVPIRFQDGVMNYIAILSDGNYCMTAKYDH